MEEETRSFLEKNQNILYRLSDVILQEETINRGQLLEIIGREG
jgi:ATP-dependent Zn protease